MKSETPVRSGEVALDSAFKLRPRSVLEIYGPSGSGKSGLLLAYVANCILPEEHRGVLYGGQGGCVVYLDLDCKFDIRRLRKLLTLRIHQSRAQLGLGRDPVSGCGSVACCVY